MEEDTTLELSSHGQRSQQSLSSPSNGPSSDPPSESNKPQWQPLWQPQPTKARRVGRAESGTMVMRLDAEEIKLAAKDERRNRESFRKRKKTIFKNSNTMSKRCHADVYIIVCRKGRWFTYTSTEKLGWPPTVESMANIYPLPTAVTPPHFEYKEHDETGSEVGNSRTNTPDDDTEEAPHEPVEDNAQPSEVQARPMEVSKRVFVVPRAPRFVIDPLMVN